MKNRVINFKEEEIQNCYNIDYITFSLPTNWFDYNLKEQNEWFSNLCNKISELNKKGICIIINFNGEEKFDEYEQLHIISKVAEQTITDLSTNRGYLGVPTWFKDRVFSSVDIQKKLGNFKNKFEKLQISLYHKGEIVERLVE